MKVKYRDLLAAGLLGATLTFWGLQGAGLLKNLPSEVSGALIACFTLIVQFYFRKKPSGEAVDRE